MNYIVYAVGALLAVCGGVGFALIVTSLTLSSSNNVGGNRFDERDYDIKIDFGDRRTYGAKTMHIDFFASVGNRLKKKYEPVPDETVHIMTKEELENIKADNTKSDKIIIEGYDFDEDLPPVDGPLFKPLE